MGLDRDISLEGLKNAAINRWDKYAEEMKGEVRESGEELVEEFQKGIDSAVKKINLKSMSSQLKRAVQDFGKETKYLDSILDGITVGAFEIDLSNIEINSDEIKSRVVETLNDIIESGSIDAKDKDAKKTVERMLGTYFSDLEKVNELQDSGRNLYGKQYISNAQKQIALMTEMQDIARFLGQDHFIDWSDHISTAMRCIREEAGETEEKIERTFKALKEYGKDTFDFSGNFVLDRGNFSQTDLDARIQLLQELIELQDTWHFAQSEDSFSDYYTGTSGFDLEDILEKDQEKLRLMRKLKVKSTQELHDMANEFQNEINSFNRDYSNEIQEATKNGNFDQWIESLENDWTKLKELRGEMLDDGSGRGALLSALLSEDDFEILKSNSMDGVEKILGAIKMLKQLRQVKYLQDFTNATNALDEGFRDLPKTREMFNSLCNDITENGLSAADAIKTMTEEHQAWVAEQEKASKKKKRTRKKKTEEQPQEAPVEEKPKKKRTRKKKQEEQIEGQTSLLDDQAQKDAEKSASKEAENLDKVADKAKEATKAKKDLAKATEEAEEASKKAAELTKKEKENLDELSGAIVRSGEAHDKIKIIEDADGNIVGKTVTDSRTKQNSIETESSIYRYEDGEKILEAKIIVEDFKKRAAELKREQDKIELAQKTLNKFLSQFESKTSGQASTITGYNELKGFTIGSLDDIEKATQKMIALDTEYNNVTKNFRKGTKSMNPFVNAITGAGEMGDKVKQATTSFNELSKKPEELKGKVDGLNDKLAEMRKYAEFDESGNLVKINDIYEFSKAYGELNAEIKSVNSSIQTQRKEQGSQASELKQLESIQNKLYAAKTKRATSSYDADDLDAQDARIKRLEEEYELKKQGVKFDENSTRILERENQLQNELYSIIDRRAKREEKLYYAQQEKEEKKYAAAMEKANADYEKDKKAEQARLDAEEKAQLKHELDLYDQEESKKQKELNELYKERQKILAEIFKYTKKLMTAPNDNGKQAAQAAIDAEKSRLDAKTNEILQYGDLADLGKLGKQDRNHTDSLRTFNWADYIKKQAAEQKELNGLYDDYAESVAKIIRYREKLNSGKLGKDETRRTLEKLQGEKENQKALQKQINSYGDLHDAAVQQAVVDEKRKIVLKEIADAQAKAATKEEETAKKASDKSNQKQAKENVKQKEKELNALYQEREQIIKNILKYTIALQNAGMSFDEIQNSSILKGETARQHAVDANIARYGTLVDNSVLEKQDNILKEGLRNNNIKDQIDDQEQGYKDLIKLQKEYYD